MPCPNCGYERPYKGIHDGKLPYRILEMLEDSPSNRFALALELEADDRVVERALFRLAKRGLVERGHGSVWRLT